jgi:hypothetical protein
MNREPPADARQNEMGYLRAARDDGRDSLRRANAPPQEISGREKYSRLCEPDYRRKSGSARKIAFDAESEYGEML